MFSDSLNNLVNLKERLHMRKYVFVLICLSMFVPHAAIGEDKVPFVIEGVIGDFADRSRIYEVDGTYYQFQKDIIIETQDGKRLTFRHLRGGLHIQIVGEKLEGKDSTERTQYNKIIILN